MRRLTLIVLFLTMAFEMPAASAAESVRTQEINQCLSGEVMTWGDGRDRAAISSSLNFTYNSTGAPDRFSASLVSAMVERAAAEWSHCGVPAHVVDRNSARDRLRDVIVVHWSEKGSGGNFGLANLGTRTIALGPKAFELLKARNPAYDARETLQLVISHEMGHFFGLMAHSRRCVDVLSYYDNGKGDTCYSRDPSQLRTVREYRHILPTACDIERCRKINGMSPLPDGRVGEQSPQK